MKNYIGVFIIAILLVLVYFEFKPSGTLPSSGITTSAATSHQPVNYTASFTLFTDNSVRSLNDPKYQNLSADIYIESDNPNTIHIKKAGVSWGDFFKTLPIELTEDCLSLGVGQMYCNGQGGNLKFYINNKRVSNILSQKIHKGDKLLISYGYETPEEIKSQLEQISNPVVN